MRAEVRRANGRPAVGAARHDETPEPTGLDTRSTAERLGLQEFTLVAVEQRAGSDSLFDVMGVHFSASRADVIEARDKLLGIFAAADHHSDEMARRLARERQTIADAAETLCDDEKRRTHREEVADPFQVEMVLEMYLRRGDTAQFRRDRDAALSAYEHVLELSPGDEYAHEQMVRVRRGEFESVM